MIKLTVNGESFELVGADISALIRQLDANADHVAVMVNGAIVPREGWSSSSLADGDRIEVLTFAAGG